jgi:hypothetical protein
MKKILVLFNGINAPWHITTFALNTARQNDAEVYALFLKDERSGYPYPSDIDTVQSDATGKREEKPNEELEEKNIELFKTFCEDEKVKCNFQRNVSLNQLIDLSSNADCIVADSHDDFQRYSLKDILTRAKCPVCLISANATKIKSTVLLYDGSDDAIRAIKAFNNLFPKSAKKKSYLVIVSEKEKIKRKEREEIFKKAEKRFPDLEMVSFSKKIEKKLIEFLDDHTEDTMVVMAAYEKGGISKIFKPGVINMVLEQSRTSLFIDHN